MSAPDPRDAWVVFYRRTFGLAAAALIGYLIYRILEPFFGPLVWATFLAFLLQPAQRRTTALLRGRDSVASFVLTIVTLVLLVGPLTILGGMFAAQARVLIQKVQQWTAALQISSVQDFENLPFTRRAFGWLENNVG